MRLAELFKIAEKGGNSPERVSSDKREAFVYMDVTSCEYRKQAAKHSRYSR
jgi:hypothetical protein